MKKKILSGILSALLLMSFSAPINASASADYKDIYFDFLKDNLITRQKKWRGATLADLNLDGTPELIMYDSGATSSHGIYIFQIIDNKVQLRYAGGYVSGDYFEKGSYFNLSSKLMGIPPSLHDSDYVFSLRKNKNTGDLMYTHFSVAGGIDFHEDTLLYFSKDDIFIASEKLYMNIEKDDVGNVISTEYAIDGNAVSEWEYNSAYNEFFDTWQDTGYEFAWLDCWGKVTEQDIRDFLGMYVPEKQALGLVDNTPKYNPFNCTFRIIDCNLDNDSDITYTYELSNNSNVWAGQSVAIVYYENENGEIEAINSAVLEHENVAPYSKVIDSFVFHTKSMDTHETLTYENGLPLPKMVVMTLAADEDRGAILAELEENGIYDIDTKREVYKDKTAYEAARIKNINYMKRFF